MNGDTIKIMNSVKSLGINVVGCKAKKYAHYTAYTIFLKENLSNDTILQKVKNAGFKLVFDFIQDYGYKYKHDANKILTIRGD